MLIITHVSESPTQKEKKKSWKLNITKLGLNS